MTEKGRPLPKFGEWDVNDPSSAEGFTVIFNKARDEKKTGGKPDSPAKNQPNSRSGMDSTKSQPIVLQYEEHKPTPRVSRAQSGRRSGYAVYKSQTRSLDETRLL